MDAQEHDIDPLGDPQGFNERDAVDLALLRLYRATRCPARLERLLSRFDLLLSGIVSPWSPPGEPADELVPQLALLGFLRAIERYDQSCGVSFATFARVTVMAEIDRRHVVAARTRRATPDRVPASDARDAREGRATGGPDVVDVDAREAAEAFELLGRRDVETQPLDHIGSMLRTDLALQVGASVTQVSRVLNRALVRLHDDLRNSPDLAHADDPTPTAR